MSFGLELVLGALVVLLGGSALLGLLWRVPSRLAVRNVRRGRERTLLLILGLLISTTIVSGSLVIGDTVNAIGGHFVYDTYGHVDEAIVNQTASGSYAPFPYAVAPGLQALTRGDPQIVGITPMVVGSTTVYDRSSGIPQANLNLVGVPVNASVALGSFATVAGASVAGPTARGVLLDQQAADDLNASSGDLVVLFGTSAEVPLTVQGIVRDDTRGGFLGGGSAFVALATAQALESLAPGTINYLAVSNAGSDASAAGISGSVVPVLTGALVALGSEARGLVAVPVIAQALSSAAASASSFTTLFLVLGLFSIVAGAMLIVGIFVMLAEERKSEMGTLRALGLKRRDLVGAFYFEGVIYSAGGALAGTFLGLAVAYLMIYAFSLYLAAGTATGAAILASFTASPASLVIGYTVGFCLTLLTISITSLWVGRLNIVRALRAIPEPAPPRRVYTSLAYLGAGGGVVGGLLLATTRTGATDISIPLAGGAMLILGVMLILTRFVPNRWAFSAGALALLIWGGFEPLHRAVLGSAHTGTIFVVFLEGILLVLGAVLLYTFNSGVVVGAIGWLVGRRPAAVPVVRIGLTYPSRRPFRTAVNLTIFALVLFTIVAVASFGSSLQTDLGNTIQAESGGYSFVGFSANPIPDLPGQIAQNATLAPYFSAAVPLMAGAAQFNWSGLSGPWSDGVYSAPTNSTGSSNFYQTNRFNFTQTLDGRTAAQVWQQIASDPGVAVVDNGYTEGVISFGTTSSHPGLTVGTRVTLTNATGTTSTVTVIGIMAQSFVSGIFVNPGVARTLGIATENLYFLTVAAGMSTARAGQLAQRAFFPYGLVLVNFAQVLQTSIQSVEAIIGLLEIFVALGLAVGIAAVGIVALRAVVERRAEIGMLRAIGFRRSGIQWNFLLEYSYVALLGIGIGTVLGIVLVYEASAAQNGFLITFSIPWLNVGIVVGVAYLLTVAAILGPARRAAALPPAAAVRYVE